jgi:hypothetical protein
MNRVLGILLFVLAAAIAIVPVYTKCGGSTMPCNFSFKAEIALAISLFAAGVLTAVLRRRETLPGVAVVGLILGVSVILVPTVLIGVCGSPMMHCVSQMKPALLVLGALTILVNLGTLYYALKK